MCTDIRNDHAWLEPRSKDRTADVLMHAIEVAITAEELLKMHLHHDIFVNFHGPNGIGVIAGKPYFDLTQDAP